MKRDILATAADLQATEDDCSKHNPPVIREYLSASDEDRPLFEVTFKGFKAITQLKAKARWYSWRIDLMQRLQPDVEAVWEGMKEVSQLWLSKGSLHICCLARAEQDRLTPEGHGPPGSDARADYGTLARARGQACGAARGTGQGARGCQGD
jgi:hypothetical protein